MADEFKSRRFADFGRRAEYAPGDVYRHRLHGWEYIPVHPFADELEALGKLGLRPEDCTAADAWWSINGDATLLQTMTARMQEQASFHAKPTPHDDRWVYLVAILDRPFIIRDDFEAAMTRFAQAGFPADPRFHLRWNPESNPILKV